RLHGRAAGRRVGPRAGDLGRAGGRLRESRPTAGCQPWRVPQRRQKRAVADRDRPQLEHGWTPETVAVTAAFAGRARTSWAEAAHSASLEDPRARLARRAIAGDSS